MIESLAWVLPRPNKSKYIGSFPLHFEKKLLSLLEVGEEHTILHPFGGKAEFGLRVDVKSEVEPDILADAHQLPIKDNAFDVVIVDPPYSDAYAKRLYGTDNLHFNKFVAEAVRVCKEGGHIVMYHYLATPSLRNTILVKRIFMETRVWHKLRCIHIHQKRSDLWQKETEKPLVYRDFVTLSLEQ